MFYICILILVLFTFIYVVIYLGASSVRAHKFSVPHYNDNNKNNYDPLLLIIQTLHTPHTSTCKQLLFAILSLSLSLPFLSIHTRPRGNSLSACELF